MPPRLTDRVDPAPIPVAAPSANGTTAAGPPLLLDARHMAALLGISARTVVRLAARGELPPPLRLGHLVRWSRAALELWIVAQSKLPAE